MIVFGVDPGIANTGLAVIESVNHKYCLLAAAHVKTSAQDSTGERLSIVSEAVKDIIVEYSLDGLAVERVFHNKNVSSSIATGKVIGLCELIAFDAGIPCDLITPQQVKYASGFGRSADKTTLLRISSRLFRVAITSHHVADAALVGLGGCLRLRCPS